MWLTSERCGWWPWGLPNLGLSLTVIVTADSAQDLAAELVHYGFLHEVCEQVGPAGRRQDGLSSAFHPLTHPPHPHTLQDDRTKLAAFLESTFLKYRGTQP